MDDRNTLGNRSLFVETRKNDRDVDRLRSRAGSQLWARPGTAASIGFHRVSAEARDLGQVRLAIEALRALEPVLREGGVGDAPLRDLEQARTNLQLAYAKAVGETSETAEKSDSP